VAYAFGVVAGAWLAWKRGSWFERAAVPIVLATRAAPEFWIGNPSFWTDRVHPGDRDRVTRQLRAFQLTRWFAARVCSGDTLRKKPHPAPLRLALQKMRLSPDDCVYVGDSLEDVEMARRAGVRAIGMIGPFPTEKRLRASKPHLLLNSIRELPEALKELLG